jgi:hypothetical protein
VNCTINDGNLIPIIIRIYGTELEMFITQNTEANFVYNVVAAWMGQDPGLIKIQVCKTRQPREGMDHVLDSKDHLWVGFYNFDLFKATIRKEKVNILNYKF